MRTRLRHGEEILYEAHDKGFLAALFSDLRTRVGLREKHLKHYYPYQWGSLFLTNKRLIFEKKKYKHAEKTEIIIKLDDVHSVKTRKHTLLDSMEAIIIRTKSNNEYTIKHGTEYSGKEWEKFIIYQMQFTEQKARDREQVLDYQSAIEIWEKLGKMDEARRVRRIIHDKQKVKIAQKVIHGDYFDDRDTIVKDSVISQSSIGGGSENDLVSKLRELADMKREGLLTDEEFAHAKAELIREKSN